MKSVFGIRLLNEFRDFLLYFVLPVPALILPWRWVFGFYIWLTRRRFSFGIDLDAVEKNLQRLGFEGDINEALSAQKMVRLLDILDMWMGFFYPLRAQKQLIEQHGSWPDKPAVLVTTHVGSGTLSFANMRSGGIAPYYLLRETDHSLRKYRFVLWRYQLMRQRYFEKVLPALRFNDGLGIKPIEEKLKQGESLFTMCDVMPNKLKRSSTIRVNGHALRIHSGIFNIAAANKIPVVLYELLFDRQTGKRIYTIHEPFVTGSEEELREYLDSFISRTIQDHLPQWQMLPFLDAYLPDKI